MDEIESLPDLTRTLAERVPLRGLRLQDLDLTGHEEELLGPHGRRGHGRARRADDPRAGRPPSLARRARLPDRPARAGQPVPLVALPAARALRGPARARLRGHSGRPRLPLVPRRRLRARRLRHPAAGHPRRLGHRRARRVPRGGVRRGRHGRPRRLARHRAVRRGGPARPPARSGRARRPHRWRTGGDGGRQPRRPGARRHAPSTTRWPGSPPSRRSSPTSHRGPRSRSACTTTCCGCRWPTRGCAASASPRGSTATSRPTCSATASPSTSRTPCGRTACSRAAPPGSSSSRVRRARCRRSSRSPPGSTTPTRSRCCPVVVLVGEHHWTHTLPVWPALRALAHGRPMAERVHLVATVDDAAELVTSSR